MSFNKGTSTRPPPEDVWPRYISYTYTAPLPQHPCICMIVCLYICSDLVRPLHALTKHHQDHWWWWVVMGECMYRYACNSVAYCYGLYHFPVSLSMNCGPLIISFSFSFFGDTFHSTQVISAQLYSNCITVICKVWSRSVKQTNKQIHTYKHGAVMA